VHASSAPPEAGATEGAPARPPGVGRSLPAPLKMTVTRARSAAWLARGGARRMESGLRIIFYHRVSDDRDDLAVPPRHFRAHMDWLASAGYRVVDVLEAARLLDEQASTPAKTVGLSFDDGFLDVAENALPVLAEHGFRATVFVSTGVADGRATFSWYRRQPPVIGWDDMRALDAGGTLGFEAHTVTHPNLLAVSDDAARAEIVDSKQVLEDRLGRPVRAFCYPAGLFGDRERTFVAEAGYSVAVSCEPGRNVPLGDRLALRRLQIDARDELLDFRAKVGGGHDRPLPLRRTYRRLRYGMAGGSARAANAAR
jgi:peptidoglycan/xylan/chitin deacetylase (PgdA/CDA1 family)